MDSIIYLGLAINVIGAIMLAVFAIAYYKKFKEYGRLTVRLDSLKTEWAHKRALSFGLLLGGTAIALIGCFL